MILREATIKYKGYDPLTLSKGSEKRVCKSCDQCGRVRYVSFNHYRNLCRNCKMKSSETRKKMSDNHANVFGKNNPNYKKPMGDEQKQKISDAHKGKYCGKNNPMYGKRGEETGMYGRTGDKNPMFGKHLSKETKKKISKSNKGKIVSKETKQKISKSQLGKLNHAWRGGYNKKRPYLLPITQCLHINERFEGSHAHHIAADVIVFIPRDLHQHIKHSLKNNIKMYEMNLLSLQYIKGEL